jgi:hypothetical protein
MPNEYAQAVHAGENRATYAGDGYGTRKRGEAPKVLNIVDEHAGERAGKGQGRSGEACTETSIAEIGPSSHAEPLRNQPNGDEIP